MLEADICRRFDGLLTDGIYSLAWRYCARLCRTREDAEDLLQDSLLQAVAQGPVQDLRMPGGDGEVLEVVAPANFATRVVEGPDGKLEAAE